MPRAPIRTRDTIIFTIEALLPLHALGRDLIEPLQQFRQLYQILSAKKRSAGRNLHKRIDACRIGAARRYRLHLSFRVVEIHAIFAPVVAVLDKFELLPK